MIVRETFHRPQELGRELHRLPGQIYNLAYRLRRQAGAECLFVPIRTMQYLAILDAHEFAFVDGAGHRVIEISWSNFRPWERGGLGDPVPYDAVFYQPSAQETMRRLPGEFLRALHALATRVARRSHATGTPDITPLNPLKISGDHSDN
ncbi:MAG: hypothetical protein ACYC18_01925 [Gammaproteobacteria bacterium]|nr:hypothetical protein [Gammaproteobacteria bacterium]